jgi:hypothetical protein
MRTGCKDIYAIYISLQNLTSERALLSPNTSTLFRRLENVRHFHVFYPISFEIWLFENFVLMNQNLFSNRSQNTTCCFVERRWCLLKI